MIAEIGHFSLIIALFLAIVQTLVPMIGAARNDRAWMAVADMTAIGQFLFVAVSFGALMACYVTSDFSVLNVIANSHTDKPLLYKIAGVWSNHEGSMLLWVLILCLYGFSVALFGQKLPPQLRARALSVQAMIGVGFFLFILFTSNPFLRVDPAPLNGEGLNPLLQDPGLAFHPPFLYLGYVGFSMAFSFAIAALIGGRIDAAWARWVRPWTLAAWTFLTLGIVMGSWWAYYTLGWGGWWYWDPVENASFMPWLVGTALIHSSAVVEKRDALKTWTVLLTIFAFVLSLMGTFLVRSGILTSVHSFASDPARGVFVLVLLGLVTGGALILFAWRGFGLKDTALFAPVSRESGLLFNNIILSVAAASVLLGTLYPLFIDALSLGKVSVGAPFFNAVFVPLSVPLIVAMAIGPMLTWKRGDARAALKVLKIALALSVATTIVAALIAEGKAKDLAGCAAIGLAVGVLASCAMEWQSHVLLGRLPFTQSLRRAATLPRSAYGMVVAHAGVAVLMIGIAGSSTWQTEKIQIMHVGESVRVAAYDVSLDAVQNDVAGPNYSAMRATFTAHKNGRAVTTLSPERRQYTMPPMPTTNAAIHTTVLGDLYVVIGDADSKGGYVTRLYFNPLVAWIFFGALMIAFGGALSITDRRYRLGAPNRKRR